ncbi:MAG TPA: Hsp20/alpha crystallin family protein [Candidatus Brocadiaceae bacterium]|nr:Hsp20/alpha crystallin family protein [Candidatus Brocadiaceae bacterium]
MLTSNTIIYKTDARQNKIESFLKEFLNCNKNFPTNPSTTWQPPTDIYETEDEIVVKMSIPGTRPDDIHVVLTNEILTVSGYISDTSPHERTCFYQVEIRYGHFERSFPIPKPVNTENIQATYKEGFLMVVLQKAKQQEVKRFSIKIIL